MTGERKTPEPPFTVGRVAFRTWIVPTMPNELGLIGERYEYRSGCGRCVVTHHYCGESPKARYWQARLDGKLVACCRLTAKDAMVQAATRLTRMAQSKRAA